MKIQLKNIRTGRIKTKYLSEKGTGYFESGNTLIKTSLQISIKL
ncbi:hypothetical protein [Flavobacterium sp. JP2137]